MEERCITHRDKHDDETHVGAEDLDHPATGLNGKDWGSRSRPVDVGNNPPRPDDKDRHWLDADHNCANHHHVGWAVAKPVGGLVLPAPLVGVPDELCQVGHDTKHDSNLQPMEKIDQTSIVVLERGTARDTHKGANEHRPTSAPDDGGESEDEGADGSEGLEHGHLPTTVLFLDVPTL